MKLLWVTALIACCASVVLGAALQERDAAAAREVRAEAAELLLEAAQLDAKLQEKRELAANKRSYGSTYGASGYGNAAGYGASAGDYGASSGGYNAGGYEPNFEYHEPQVPAYPKPTFDLWGFKRAILSALYQAVRAVAGGSIAVKGQLIRGGGNLVSTQGKLIASGGQAVSELGRSIAHSALHSAPAVPAVTYTHHVASPGYASYSGSSYGGYHHNEGPGVLETIGKAKIAVGSAVGNAVGNVVAGAAGAVGSAVAGAAGAVAGVVSGAADAVSHHVAAKLNPAPVVKHNYVAQPVAYKPSGDVFFKQPILVSDPAHAVYTADPAATYGGSLEESFGARIPNYQHQHQQQQQAYADYSIQPSISYDLH